VRARPLILASVLTGLALYGPPAHATWTITAVDPATGEVGTAGATCGRWVWVIARVVPDEGAVVAQGNSNLDARDEAEGLLAEGETPDAILDAITAGDDDVQTRQYGVASLNGAAAAFNGSQLEDYAGSWSDEYVSVQGNILASEAVVTEAFNAYLAAEEAGEPLAERLLLALEAGAAEGGDSRCDPDKAAKSAYLLVAAPGDDPDDLSVSLKATQAVGSGSPVDELREAWDSGERKLGCSSVPTPASLLLALPALLGLALRRRATASRR
jgi:MYXO-CTERM domain-containing protein